MPRFPSHKPFLKSYPIVKFDEMNSYKHLLVSGMKRVFRNLVSVDVVMWTDNWKNVYYKVDIKAINPKPPKSVWNQYILIDKTCAKFILDGGQDEAAWRHSWKYLNKILRIISDWLVTIAEDKLSAERQRLRMNIIKREIIARTIN